MSYWGNRKPHFGMRCGIDWSHPLARGLRLCLLFNEGGGAPRDISNYHTIVPLGAPAWTPAGYLTGSTSDYVSCRNAPNYGGAVTVWWRGRVNAWPGGATRYWIAGWSNTDTTIYEYDKILSIKDSNKAASFYTYSGWAINVDASTAITLGVDTDILGVHDLSDLYVYLNGRSDASPIAAAASYAGYTTPRILLNSPAIPPAVYTGALVVTNVAGVWLRALSAAEVAWLYAEPYAMIQAPEMPVFYSIPAGGSSIAAISQYYARMRAA